MRRLLPDTSAWVEYLRDGSDSPSGRLLAPAAAAGEIVVCGPVVAELLAGASAADRESLHTILLGLPWADLGRAEWAAVGRLAADLRGAGATVPLTDVEIAVAAIGAEADVITRDSDFDRFAAVETRLRVRRP